MDAFSIRPEIALFLVALLNSLVVVALVLFWRGLRRRLNLQRNVEIRMDQALEEICRIERQIKRDSAILFDETVSDFVRRAARDANGILAKTRRSIADIRGFKAWSPTSAETVMVEVEAQIAIAREMFWSADGLVHDLRRIAADWRNRVQEWSDAISADLVKLCAAGHPFHDEAVRLSHLQFGLLADKYAVHGDPLGVMRDLSETVRNLASLSYAVSFQVALRERVIEMAKILPARHLKAENILPIMMRALADLRAKRPDPRWEPIQKTVQSFPAILEKVRDKLQANESLSGAKEPRLREIFADALAVEESLDLVDAYTAAILEQWAELERDEEMKSN